MIFKQWEQVMGLKLPPKNQTRRIRFPYELARQLHKHGWGYPREAVPCCDGLEWRWGSLPWGDWLLVDRITLADINEANIILSQEVITLPLQPGRGKKALGRIQITGTRLEKLQEIRPEEFVKEGLVSGAPIMVVFFIELWDGIYRKPYRWEDNPEVCVLDFELSGKGSR